MRTRFFARLAPWLPVLTMTSALALAGACGPKEAPPPAETGGGKKVDAATAGSLSGRVVLNGTPPPAGVIRMNTDPVCAQNGATAPSETAIVSDTGGIANAFVYVKDGVDPAYTFDVPTTPVVAGPEGLPLHAARPRHPRRPAARRRQQRPDAPQRPRDADGQPGVQPGPAAAGRAAARKTFTAPEVMVRFKCNVHGWMRAYVGVVSNPFFAVTEGRRRIQDCRTAARHLHDRACGTRSSARRRRRSRSPTSRTPRSTSPTRRSSTDRAVIWLHRYARLLASATLLLVAAGGMVTSTNSGLSVPDWPTTYGYSMFSFPLSKMVGGIFYEHGHRLIATTVGLLTIGLVVFIWRVDPRPWMRRSAGRARRGHPAGRARRH